MQKMNFTNPQVAFDYALYMMASSCFAKSTCKSKFLERNMLVQFKEQKLNTQYQMEELCISLLAKQLRKLPKAIRRQEMTVHLRKRAGRPTDVLFVGSRYIVSFSAVYAGKSTKLDCSVWEKTPDAAASAPAPLRWRLCGCYPEKDNIHKTHKLDHTDS